MLTYAQARRHDITGTWNALDNIASNLPADFNKLEDWYTPADTLYAVSVSGNTPLSGYTTWNAGDYAYCDGTRWYRIENLADAVATPNSPGVVQPDNITTFVDSHGVISAVQSAPAQFLGDWDPVTNTPFLVNGVGTPNSYYISTAVGSCNFGAGLVSFDVGSVAAYDNGQWVNTGVVVTSSSIQVPATFALESGFVTAGDSVTTALGKLQGQLGSVLQVKVSDYVVTPFDKVILLKADNLTITLPDASAVVPGYQFLIKVGGMYNATVDTQFGQTVDGTATYSLTYYNAMTFFSDGFDWFVA